MSDTLTTTFQFWVLIINQLTVLTLVGVVTWAAYNDIRAYTIPNVVVLIVLSLYIPFVLTAPESINWGNGLLTFSAVIVAGFLLFAVGVIGAGDIKLFAAVALWAGSSQLYMTFTVMAFTGGALGIAYLAQHFALKFIGLKSKDNNPARVVLPYGVAIAGGTYFVAYQYLQPIFTGISGA